jgi:cytochrome c553
MLSDRPSPDLANSGTAVGVKAEENEMNRIWTMMSLMLALTPAAMRAQTVVGVETTGELKAALALSGDPVRGKAAYNECEACHRKDASGRTNGATPRLSGQHASVIVKQVWTSAPGSA